MIVPMNTQHLHAALLAVLAVGLVACDTGTETEPTSPELATEPVSKETETTVVVDHDKQELELDFPTIEVVGYVLNCMSDGGGQNLENLYSCACRIDYISARMDFNTYDSASTYRRYRRMPGEKGGVFRENQDADQLIGKLEEHEAGAARACPIVKRSSGSKDTEPT